MKDSKDRDFTINALQLTCQSPFNKDAVIRPFSRSSFIHPVHLNFAFYNSTWLIDSMGTNYHVRRLGRCHGISRNCLGTKQKPWKAVRYV